MEATMMDGYIRVSDVGGKEGERYASPTLQRRAIEQAAARLGESLDEVIVEWFPCAPRRAC